MVCLNVLYRVREQAPNQPFPSLHVLVERVTVQLAKQRKGIVLKEGGDFVLLTASISQLNRSLAPVRQHHFWRTSCLDEIPCGLSSIGFGRLLEAGKQGVRMKCNPWIVACGRCWRHLLQH